MTLEDHVGDVIGKARTSAGLSQADIARIAGVEESVIGRLERDGVVPDSFDFQAVGSRLGLSHRKLAAVSGGWTPTAVDLAAWRGAERISSAGLDLEVHAYLVWDPESKEAALFDTGFDFEPIFDRVTGDQLQLRHLFLTHTHRDHIAALDAVRERVPTVEVHSDAKNAPQKQRLRPDDTFRVGRLLISNRETPGHAEDGVTYVVEGWPGDAPALAMVGDVMFAGSMGGAGDRLDLAKKKAREHILSLPEDTVICPGHGPLTTVGEEKRNNPFFL